MSSKYIHGTHREEQDRLAVLNRLLNERCIEKIDVTESRRILDIGSGLGLFSRMLAKRAPRAEVVAVERESDQIKRAMEFAFEAGETDLVQFRMGDAYDLPLLKEEWGEFDLIFMRFLLEHVSDPMRALRQAWKAMAPGGKIILVDDDHANFRIAPPCQAFDRLWAAYSQVYVVLGNDPYIGRKLVTHLHQAGFRDFKADFVLFGGARSEPHFMDYADNLIGILEGARSGIEEMLNLDSFQFDTEMEQIRKWSEKPDAALWYAANWAEAIK